MDMTFFFRAALLVAVSFPAVTHAADSTSLKRHEPQDKGAVVKADSGIYQVTVPSEGWMKSSGEHHPGTSKDLRLFLRNGHADITFEISDVARDAFTSRITDDLREDFSKWQAGSQHNRNVTAKCSETEFLPVKLKQGKATLGRYCYSFEIENQPTTCVYEAFISRRTGEVIRAFGHTASYRQMNSQLDGDLRAIITSLTFRE